MIAIHNSKSGFHARWIAYCEENNIPYKVVNCYADELNDQLKDCKALMWHHSQQNPKDLVIAKQILFALEHTGLKVFPDFKTGWHFDDKLGQKYLFERLVLPFVPTYAFYDKKEAVEWASQTSFPKVFKLRGGAGSVNVKLVNSQQEAFFLIKRAFGKGFDNYDKLGSLKERWKKYREGKAGIWEPIKGLLRFGVTPPYAQVLGKEKGYVYFQDFIPNNNSDTRIIVIGEKAFALKRYVRKGDFRASGSGNFAYAKNEFDECCVKLAFEANEKLHAQCAAFDFVFDKENNPFLVEVSYGFVKEVYDPCPGYWDKELNWNPGKFNPQGWMVEMLVKEYH
ncbi:ATP-grasp domain-containing protein [Pleomorphovibrio marinus]|uniref:ATP-grasp domain-containing protein n=1 Tax=Pleomorphovibrio marinus TaxID=2164132 RepID=UPI0018E4EEE4|nr:hypothetical protein [Pleomorphovibrio marinus]